MKYQLEFEREVVTRDGYDVVVEAGSPAEADELAERMACEMAHNCPDEAHEIGPAECRSWNVSGVKPVVEGDQEPTNVLPFPANDKGPVDRNSGMTLPMDVWEGLLRAAQIGLPTLGTDDRSAIAAVAALKAHIHIDGERIAASR